jgi:hypothetical protein
MRDSPGCLHLSLPRVERASPDIGDKVLKSPQVPAQEETGGGWRSQAVFAWKARHTSKSGVSSKGLPTKSVHKDLSDRACGPGIVGCGRLRIGPPPNERLIYRFTLDDLEELAISLQKSAMQRAKSYSKSGTSWTLGSRRCWSHTRTRSSDQRLADRVNGTAVA